MEKVEKIAEYRNEEFDEKLKKQMSEIPEEYHNTPRYKELKRLYDTKRQMNRRNKMKITNRNSLYNAVNKLIRIHNRKIKNRKNFAIYKYKVDDYDYECEEVYYKQSIEEEKIIDAISEYLEIYDYADGINWEKTKILKEYDEDIDEEQSYGIWIWQRTEYEDSYYGTITFKIPKNKKYVQFDYSI